ncbi:MAG: RNB domain-containing ribonuclease [Candidatus Korobacteraceae bacterium]|jgi:ribonuclease R
MLTDQAILRHIERQPHHSAGYKQLVREMNLRGDDRRLLAERLQALVKSARLVETGRDRYTLAEHAAARQNLIAGRLTMHRDGYGFVIPNAGQRSTIAGDIFIPPPAIGSAMHGDQVLVELTPKRGTPGSQARAGLGDDGRAEGRILRVLTRGNPTVVGTFHRGPRQNYVTPMDEKVTQQIIIPRGLEWPGGSAGLEARESSSREKRASAPAGAPHKRVPQVRVPSLDANLGKQTRDRVLGKEARRQEWTDLENVVVEVEITDWPSPTENPRGRVLEILGYEDDFGVDVEIVIRKFHLPHHFPVEVLQDAQQFEPVISASQLHHRRDYRALPIVTIDGETARDFDDAVTVRRTSNGNFELQVHIADVAHYVREDSAIDLEARLRGTSVYFPDRAVPMLPLELSTDLCSLRPQVDRMVLSCVMEIDHQGEIIGYTLSEGVIHSAERMTYTNVNLILEGDPAQRERYHQLVDVFELMRELAVVLNRKRVRRGSIDFDLPEPVIEFDEHGLMRSITRSERNIANRIIEEFMLSANECVASYLESKGVASLYRIHEKPDPRRVMDFETIAARFGYSLGVGPLPVKRVQFKAERRERYGTGRGAKTVEIPEDIHITPRMYQKLTQKIAGKPEERILSYLMLRSLKQARYSEKNEGHFALAAPTYTHFTSPIRRYPDLIVHRILKDVLREAAEREEHGVPIGEGAVAARETPSPWSKRADVTHTKLSSRASLGPFAERAGRVEGPLPHENLTPSSRTERERKRSSGSVVTDNRPLVTGHYSEDVLHDIADESSQAERRADEAERELMEWKKMKFMEERIGDDFDGLIVSVTKFGIFVELSDMFIEGLVPLASLTDDRYVYHENTRQIIGQRTRKTYSLGDPIRVLVDRIDRTQRRIQFAIVEERPSRAKRQRKK